MGFPQQIRVGELYQGLSNQAPWRQFPGQVKDILNMSLDVSTGARTRSGTRLVSEIATPSGLDFALTVQDMRFYHFQGAVIIAGSDSGGTGFIKAFEITDANNFVERVITGSTAYLDNSFKDTLAFTAIRDAILIMNREIVPQLLTSATYTLTGTVSNFHDLDAETPAANDTFYVSENTGVIPRGFYRTPIVTPLSQDWFRVPAPTQADAELQGSSMPHQVLRQQDDDFDFTITLGGPFTIGDTITGGTSGATGVIRSLGPGDRLTAERTSVALFVLAETIVGGGSFSEASVDLYLPDSVLSFKFSEVIWAQRLSGTQESNPAPVWGQTATGGGSPLDAMEFHSGRLFLIGGNAVTFSDARNRVNYFLDDVLDDIPIFTSTGSIDINAPNAGEIQHALSSKNSLVIIGENGQFSFTSGQERLSSINGVIEPIEEFNNSSAIPVTSGETVTIVDAFGDVRDFAFDPTSLLTTYKGNRAEHAQRILEQIETFQIFEFDDVTFFLGDSDTRLHQRKTIGGNEIQNAWSKIRFPGQPVFMWQWQDRIYILERDTDRQKYVVLDYVHRAEPIPIGFCFAPTMDFMRDVSATSYDPLLDETEFVYETAGLKTRAVKKDTIRPCRDEWWDIPNPTLQNLIDRLNAAIDEASIDYVLNENDVVDPFDDPANTNIIDSKGTYDAGGDFYLIEPFISSNLFTDSLAISISSGSGGGLVVDGNTATFWQADAIGSDPNPTIVYDFGVGNDEIIVRYEVGATATDKPVSWTFEGSNNNFTWTILDTQTSQSFSDFEIKEYPFLNATAFRYHRLRNIIESGGDGAEVSEWRAGILAENALDVESDTLPATLTPTGAIISIVVEGTLSLGVEIQAFVTRDNGTTFVEVPLVQDSVRLDGKNVLKGEMEWTDDIFGTDIRWKVVMTGLAAVSGTKLHGVSLQWFDSRDNEGNVILEPDRILSDRFFVRGDQRGEYTIGETFDWFMLLTELYGEASNVVPIISKLSFFYVNSRSFDVGIKRKALLEDPYTREFNTGDVGGNVVDENLIQTGMGMFPIGLDGRGVDIVFSGSGPIPTTLSAIEYSVRVKGKALGFGAQSESFG